MVILGHIGSKGHLEFRAVGKVVNTSQRIENLNKHLGTRVLASRAVVENISGIVSRRVGCFRLRGINEPLEIFEIGCRLEELTGEIRQLYHQYADALHLFEERNWREAANIFRVIIGCFPKDGPSQYLLHLCECYQSTPPSPHLDGAVTVD